MGSMNKILILKKSKICFEMAPFRKLTKMKILLIRMTGVSMKKKITEMIQKTSQNDQKSLQMEKTPQLVGLGSEDLQELAQKCKDWNPI